MPASIPGRAAANVVSSPRFCGCPIPSIPEGWDAFDFSPFSPFLYPSASFASSTSMFPASYLLHRTVPLPPAFPSAKVTLVICGC